jgi:hypothetical protein
VKNIFNVLAVVVLCGLLSFLSGCSGKKGQTAAQSESERQPLASIVILPAEAADGSGANAGDLNKGAGFIDMKIAEMVNEYANVRVLTTGQVDDLMDEDNNENSTDVIAHLHKTLHCDAVMVTTVHRYRQRQGSDMAVESPASASFEIRLIDAKSKAVIWVADFDETQESLFSNILTFNKAQSRGFKWVTVETLIAQGLKDRLAACPFLKK